MTRKIFRAGNSLVVSLPKDAIDLLGAGEGSEVNFEIDREERRVIILPADTAIDGVDKEFARQVNEFIEEYRPALEALAKGE
jgi:putative addiction module antidote